jgi:hypothetical protein
MRAWLESGTDAACHVLYDPAATAPLKDQADLSDDMGRAAAERGLIMPLYTASDGSVRVHVLLEEELPGEWSGRARPAAKGLRLRAPGGRLVLSGLEYVNDAERIEESLEFRMDRPALSTRMSVPAGEYEADTFVIDWDYDREVVPRLKRDLGIQYTLENTLGPLFGLLFFVGLIGSFGSLVALITFLVKGKVLAFWLLAPPVAAAAGFLGAKALETPRARERRRAVESSFPEIVVILRPLPRIPDPAGRKGGIVSLGEVVDTPGP